MSPATSRSSAYASSENTESFFMAWDYRLTDQPVNSLWSHHGIDRWTRSRLAVFHGGKRRLEIRGEPFRLGDARRVAEEHEKDRRVVGRVEGRPQDLVERLALQVGRRQARERVLELAAPRAGAKR